MTIKKLQTPDLKINTNRKNNSKKFQLCLLDAIKFCAEAIKFDAASEDGRSDDLCDPVKTIGFGNPCSANARYDAVCIYLFTKIIPRMTVARLSNRCYFDPLFRYDVFRMFALHTIFAILQMMEIKLGLLLLFYIAIVPPVH